MLIFSTKAKLLHTLDDPKYHNVAALEEAARKVPYFGGGTFTDRVLKIADEKFFDPKTDRKLIPNVLLVLTDGNTNSKSEPYPKMLAPLKVGLLTLSGPEGVGGGGRWRRVESAALISTFENFLAYLSNSTKCYHFC